MSVTASGIQTILDAIDTQISAYLSAGKLDSYRIGEVEVRRGDTLKHLLEMRKHYYKILCEFPDQNIERFDYEISEFGEDKSSYLNDPTLD